MKEPTQWNPNMIEELQSKIQILEKENRLLKERLNEAGVSYTDIFAAVAYKLCRCHFADMLPEIRYMLNRGMLDEDELGKYDACVDIMYEYQEHVKRFCNAPMNAADCLRYWDMFIEKTEDLRNGARVGTKICICPKEKNWRKCVMFMRQWKEV